MVIELDFPGCTSTRSLAAQDNSEYSDMNSIAQNFSGEQEKRPPNDRNCMLMYVWMKNQPLFRENSLQNERRKTIIQTK
jgi:hypothetical protein